MVTALSAGVHLPDRLETWELSIRQVTTCRIDSSSRPIVTLAAAGVLQRVRVYNAGVLHIYNADTGGIIASWRCHWHVGGK